MSLCKPFFCVSVHKLTHQTQWKERFLCIWILQFAANHQSSLQGTRQQSAASASTFLWSDVLQTCSRYVTAPGTWKKTRMTQIPKRKWRTKGYGWLGWAPAYVSLNLMGNQLEQWEWGVRVLCYNAWCFHLWMYSLDRLQLLHGSGMKLLPVVATRMRRLECAALSWKDILLCIWLHLEHKQQGTFLWKPLWHCHMECS